ncbi:MAG: DUF4185 domain-containing protein [Bifidobacteriaceae bacterium]|jgi:hypothetical protein|nr:DUF4185 domain-containing protein [Bifidobacteriaceae bacterium]
MNSRPPTSDFFAVADLEYHESVASVGDGDLWPSTWADDGYLYTANGDGLGFSDGPWLDIVVNRVEGDPLRGLSGQRLAGGRDVSPIWTDPSRFNSKPTGMVAVDGNGDGRDEVYLAVQDLRCGDHPDVFNEAPAAGIVRSEDGGATWTPSDGPLFADHRFTTVFFLDFGQSNTHARVLGHNPTDYVYAYGLDYNWRASFSGCVPDPTDLYLARVPGASIQERGTWEFFAGLDQGGSPRWTADIGRKAPVLTDRRRCYVPRADTKGLGSGPAPSGTYIAQGGVTYIPAFDRYVYTSWSDCVWVFYEAPAPWGPWREFLLQDFGPPPWTGPGSSDPKHGGYGVTMPSKFLSPDGREAWIQSNWFGGAATYTGNTYHFSLRRLQLAPAPSEPSGGYGDWVAPGQPGPEVNLARHGAHPIAVTFRSGHAEVLNDGRTDLAEDSWNGTEKHRDFWGYTWAEPVRLNRLVYVTGPHDWTSGFFAAPPRVEYRAGGKWVPAVNVHVSPKYPQWFASTGNRAYTFRFDAVTTTGVRIAGEPTGFHQWYSAIAELEVYFDR